MATLNHVHTYIRSHRTKSSNRVIYKCSHPNCYHTAFADMLEGKASICNQCKDTFMLSNYDLRMSRPKCNNCKETKDALEFQRGRNVMASLLEQGE